IPTRRTRPWIILACASMMLASCGGGSGAEKTDGAGTGSSQSRPAGTAEQEPAPVPAESEPLSAASTCGLPDFQAEVLRRINEMRAESRYCGATLNQPAGALQWNSKLFAAAAGHSADMATKNYFSHTSPDGRTASQRVAEAGYNWRSTG